jgi:hypothetical protein
MNALTAIAEPLRTAPNPTERVSREGDGMPEMPEWVVAVFARLPAYVNESGVLISTLDADGSIADAAPLVSDFGDVLPYLWHFGQREFVGRQLELAKPHLCQGLFTWRNRTRLFLNHDWLLGLLDLHRQSGDQAVLSMASAGATTIGEFFSCDVLLDEKPSGEHWRSWLRPANAFNGGYIELWIELFEYTKNPVYLEWAQRLAAGWSNADSFRQLNVFGRIHSTLSARLDAIIDRCAILKARLFKDNTNLVWGILALYRHTREERWKDVISRWVQGFQTHFWNNGNVYLALDTKLRGYEPSLKAGFSSLDLLCDLYHAGIQADQTRRLALSIADFWLSQQWPNGLFPEVPGGSHDHLDANVDLIVALWKLHAITGDNRYMVAAVRCRRALLELHLTPFGYCMAVDAAGRVVDARIVVKYQGLLLKLALLPRESGELLSNPELRELLRDR